MRGEMGLADSLSGAHILVTGGAGFIGSNMSEALLAGGCRVTVLDNFSTGKEENLATMKADPRFRLIRGDIRDLETCRSAVQGVDFVLHEAALGSVPRSVKDPMTTTAVNILGFVNMLYASQEAKIRRFVYAASSAAYGDSAALPKVEDSIGRPLSPYAITKYVNELYAGNFHDLYGIDTIGLRYFNVFGPRQDPDSPYAAVIPRFASAMLRGNRPVIHGDGTHSRDFTYIDNVIQANLLALVAEKPEAVNQVYNIACGRRTTLNELFQYLRGALSAYDPRIGALTPEYGPERPGDIPHSLASIERAERLLGYKADCGVREGLEHAAGWYYRHLGKPGK